MWTLGQKEFLGLRCAVRASLDPCRTRSLTWKLDRWHRQRKFDWKVQQCSWSCMCPLQPQAMTGHQYRSRSHRSHRTCSKNEIMIFRAFLLRHEAYFENFTQDAGNIIHILAVFVVFRPLAPWDSADNETSKILCKLIKQQKWTCFAGKKLKGYGTLPGNICNMFVIKYRITYCRDFV